jgi:two-component system, NtrC family, response regulator
MGCSIVPTPMTREGRKMTRLAPRIKENSRASLIDSTTKERPVVLKDIGLEGVYLAKDNGLSAVDTAPGSTHNIRLFLSGVGRLEIPAQVVRRDPHGLAFRFVSMSPGDLNKIWGHVRDSLEGAKKCPYCNSKKLPGAETCPRCGWNLVYRNMDYLSYWERESLTRKLTQELRSLEMNALQSVKNVIHKEVTHQEQPPTLDQTEEFVGTCPAMREIFSLIRKVATSELSVVILGESGTGKDLAARAIHERSLRQAGPFVPINCAAIPESLIEAELFGYEKGAFTGAHAAKKGRLECADKGTLFLDEVGELPLQLQPKLLRFLEDQLVERIGSMTSRQVNVRLIAATNRDLQSDVEAGRFRQDLYHRLKVFTIHLPPLRDRGEDTVILAQYFFKKIKMERQWACRGFTQEALDAIRAHSWPGNVREMFNRIRRAVVVQDGWIRPGDLELSSQPSADRGHGLRNAEQTTKRDLIVAAMKEHNYNITRTAMSLGLSRQYLHALVKKLNIKLARPG